MGIAGACRRHELCDIEIDDIQDTGAALIVKIKECKNKVSRTFVVTDNNNQTRSFLEIFRKYISLRPVPINHKRLFIRYINGKCTSQPIGINQFGKIPFKIAQFLSLPNPNLYTGHCFRRSSASLLADSGANISAIKRHGGWKSTVVAEGYVENSLANKAETSKKFFGVSLPSNTEVEPQPSYSYNVTHNNTLQTKDQIPNISLGNISNCTNTTININC